MLLALGRWGARAPGPPDGVGMSLDAHIAVAADAVRAPSSPTGSSATFELRFGDDPFIADVRAGPLYVERGERDRRPTPSSRRDLGALLAVVHGRMALADAGTPHHRRPRRPPSGSWTLFPLPEPALVPAA